MIPADSILQKLPARALLNLWRSRDLLLPGSPEWQRVANEINRRKLMN